jgi:hypothetical protein
VDLTEEQQHDLWTLRAEWVGVFNVTYTGTRWVAQRIDPLSAGDDDWLYDETAAGLGVQMTAHYALGVLHT